MKYRTWLQALALLAVLATRVAAQQECQVRFAGHDGIERSWPMPLDRPVTLTPGTNTLHELLDRIAAQAKFRFSYSTDVLPLERVYCVPAVGAPAGQLLSAMLAGVNADAVIVTRDHVVLAPATRSANQWNSVSDSVVSLDPLVVLGRSAAHAARTATGTVVIEGPRVASHTASTTAQLLNATAPGMWLWQSGNTMQYGSLRGVTSFGINSPKLYIDGIPAANSLIATRFAPGSIERIEVFQGPEAGVQFGGDAMSGVTSIVTRHDLAGDAVPHVELRTAMGLASSDFAVGSSMMQDHALNLRLGKPALSTSVNLATGNGGVVLPGSYVRHAVGDASIRAIRSNTVVSGTARFFTETTRQPWTVSGADSTAVQSDGLRSLQQYTAGVRLAHQANDRWTHVLLAGIDGFSIDGGSDALPYLSPADSALRSVASARRSTLRLTSTGQFSFGDAATASLVATAEHSRVRQQGIVQQQSMSASWQPDLRHSPATSYSAVVASNNNSPLLQDITGLSVQANTTFRDRVSLSGGVRLERHQANGSMPQVAALPMIRAAVQHDLGPLDARVRIAAGKGIRWPQDARTQSAAERVVNATPLEPEQQTSLEAGFDLTYSDELTLQVTRFGQTASKLIQRTTLRGVNRAADYDPGCFAYRFQNIGEISNAGWEVQATLKRGPLDLSTGFATVDSRVQQLAYGYNGDLRPGDRMLAVPARTLGVSATWTTSEWSTSVSARRAFDWVNYDRLALNQRLADPDTDLPRGNELRALWRTYDGSTHVRAAASRQLKQGIGLWVEINNLLNRQAGEPDNATFAPGRSFGVGVRASF